MPSLLDVEIMFQTRASVLAERPDAADDFAGPSTVLFITVDDLDRVETAIFGAPVVKPRHDTFYGTSELYVKQPGGNLVGFAQFKKQQGSAASHSAAVTLPLSAADRFHSCIERLYNDGQRGAVAPRRHSVGNGPPSGCVVAL